MATIQPLDVYLAAAVMGIFTGLGSAIGSYLANKHITEKLDNLRKRLKE
jgi:hypothetical protein